MGNHSHHVHWNVIDLVVGHSVVAPVVELGRHHVFEGKVGPGNGFGADIDPPHLARTRSINELVVGSLLLVDHQVAQVANVRGCEILGDRLGNDALAPVAKVQVLQVQFNAGEVPSAVAGNHLEVLIIGIEAVVEDPLVEIIPRKAIRRRCICRGQKIAFFSRGLRTGPQHKERQGQQPGHHLAGRTERNMRGGGQQGGLQRGDRGGGKPWPGVYGKGSLGKPDRENPALRSIRSTHSSGLGAVLDRLLDVELE